jgi:hypothetical protein
MSEMRNSSLLGKVIVLVFICCLVMVVLCVNTAVALDGSGTEADPWRIRSLDDFNDFAADANYWDDYTRLETDVNLAGRVYTTAVIAPDVNSSQDYFQGTAFTGVFDGNDHEVLNLTIDDGGGINKYSFLGLFGYVANGEVRNLGLEEGSVSGSGPAGGLVGQNVKGVVYNCYSNYDVNGVWFLGGLVGINDGNISHCYSTGIVNGNYYIGCLVGANLDVISSCYSTGDVNGMESVGGLVGMNIIFENWPSISDCKSTSNVNGTRLVGGLVGENLMSSIANCSSAGSVRGDNQVGGLVGHNEDGIVSDCYSTSDVSGDNIVGGLVGSISGSYNNVFNCYSTGDVNGLGDVGGLVGHIDINGEISNSFWDTDTQTHGVTDSIGLNDGTATNVSGLPTAHMQIRSTFTDANWDFINVWNIGENQTYPYLRTFLAGDINKDHITNLLDIRIISDQWLQEE